MYLHITVDQHLDRVGTRKRGDSPVQHGAYYIA